MALHAFTHGCKSLLLRLLMLRASAAHGGTSCLHATPLMLHIEVAGRVLATSTHCIELWTAALHMGYPLTALHRPMLLHLRRRLARHASALTGLRRPRLPLTGPL